MVAAPIDIPDRQFGGRCVCFDFRGNFLLNRQFLVPVYTTVLSAMTMTFVPAASTYEASGDTASLRALYYNGTRATMALSLPIVITFLIRGRTFIGLWMGSQYSKTSGTVLAILATALLFSSNNTTASAVAGESKNIKLLQNG